MSTPWESRETCDCGAPVAFDADRAGETCGGLAVVGAYVCSTCDRAYLAPGTVAAESATWKLNKGRRSVDTGKLRIRGEGRGDPEHLMARIVRVPDMERALKRIAAGEQPARDIAAAALASSATPEIEAEDTP